MENQIQVQAAQVAQAQVKVAIVRILRKVRNHNLIKRRLSRTKSKVRMIQSK